MCSAWAAPLCIVTLCSDTIQCWLHIAGDSTMATSPDPAVAPADPIAMPRSSSSHRTDSDIAADSMANPFALESGWPSQSLPPHSWNQVCCTSMSGMPCHTHIILCHPACKHGHVACMPAVCQQVCVLRNADLLRSSKHCFDMLLHPCCKH